MKKIIVIVLAIAILGVGGYLVYTKFIKKESEGSKVSLTQNTPCKYSDPDLCKFLNGWKQVKYYTYEATGVQDGETIKSVLKTVGTDKSQLTAYENGQESFNVITIGDTSYTKDYADNQWWKQTSTSTDNAVEEEQSKLDFDETKDQTSYEKIGTEACENLTCFKYKVIDPAITDSTEYIYFDNKDYQLRKIRIEESDGSVSEATIDYSKINITEPSPTKEGVPGASSIQVEE